MKSRGHDVSNLLDRLKTGKGELTINYFKFKMYEKKN